MHGTEDKAVAYNHLDFLGRGIWGSSYLAKKLKRQGYPCCIYRIQNRTHDVAAYHSVLWELEKQFLQENVMQGHVRSVDALVNNESLPQWSTISMDDIYVDNKHLTL
jgi:hypothetical protein